jgi:putative hydroxymethylpyrimidine transport system substrate-binding protein
MREICAAFIAVGALLLAGCGGGGSDAERAQAQAESPLPFRNVTISLNDRGSPQNVGILMAQQRGYFADAHLSVSILSPILPARPVQYVVTRQDELGVTQEPQLTVAKAKGAPVIAIGTLLHRATGSMMWLKKSHIGGIADLKGKTIAIPGVPFQKDFLASVLARNGLTPGDVKVKSVGYNLVPALLSGRADAIFGGSWSQEGVELESRGLQPVITRPKNLGFPPYDEAMVIARPDFVARRPGTIRDFMSAVARGTSAAVEDPLGAVKAVEELSLGGIYVGHKTLVAEVTTTLPLLSKSGYMYSEKSIRLTDWMHEQGMITQVPTPAELLTNKYVSWRP